MVYRRLFTLLSLLLIIQPVFGSKESLSDLFRSIEDWNLVKRQEIPAARVGEIRSIFGTDILRECDLVTHTRWTVEPRLDSAPSFSLEVFEVMDTTAAFTLFSAWRHLQEGGQTAELEVDALLYPEQLVFWRGNLLFRLSSEGLGAEAAEWLPKAAAALIGAVDLYNLYPVTVIQLPPVGLDPDSIRSYLGKHTLSLNPDFPEWLVPEIGFGDSIEVTVARYSGDERPVFLIGYPTPALAQDYFRRLQDFLSEVRSPEGIYMRRAGVLIAVYAGPEQRAQELLSKVKYTVKVRWIQDDEAERILEIYTEEVWSFLGVLKDTVVAILILIVCTILIGVGIGLLRYRILERFPRLFQREEMIRLDLYKR